MFDGALVRLKIIPFFRELPENDPTRWKEYINKEQIAYRMQLIDKEYDRQNDAVRQKLLEDSRKNDEVHKELAKKTNENEEIRKELEKQIKEKDEVRKEWEKQINENEQLRQEVERLRANFRGKN